MADITDQLRAARPTASPALRVRVTELAARGPERAPSLRSRLRGRRVLVLVPVAAVLAVAAAVAIGVTQPDTGRDAVPQGGAADVAGAAAPGASQTGAPELSAPATKLSTTPAGRAQLVTATLVLRVADGDALSTAAGDALGITRSLGGYVVRSDVAAGDTGTASLTLRVPSAAAQEAIARLSALGTIVTQRVQTDDLQDELDALGAQVARLRAALASVRAQLASPDLTAAERARLQARRDELTARLAGATGQRAAVRQQAASATIDLTLTTERAQGVVPVPSRLDRTLDRALDVLAWEGVLLLGLLVALAPLGLLAAAAWAIRGPGRRHAEERLLAAR